MCVCVSEGVPVYMCICVSYVRLCVCVHVRKPSFYRGGNHSAEGQSDLPRPQDCCDGAET